MITQKESKCILQHDLEKPILQYNNITFICGYKPQGVIGSLNDIPIAKWMQPEKSDIFPLPLVQL